jgi:hypothetical protein
MPVGVRVRLFKWAVIMLLVVFAVGGALFGPAIFTDLTSGHGTFATVNKRFTRLKNYAFWRSPEQKRILRTLDGHPPAPKAPDPSGPKIITTRR